MVEDRGVASATDIDAAMELGYNHPMGPLKLTDLVGLDVRLAIAENLAGRSTAGASSPRAAPRDGRPEEARQEEREGFYRWEDGLPIPRRPRDGANP